jgi:hypothetical protein
MPLLGAKSQRIAANRSFAEKRKNAQKSAKKYKAARSAVPSYVNLATANPIETPNKHEPSRAGRAQRNTIRL